MKTLVLALCVLFATGVASVTAQTRNHPLRVGGDVVAPRKLNDVHPEYPQAARAKGIKGEVILELTLDPDGRVARVDILRPVELLTGQAVVAAMQWRYESPTFRGEPAWMLLTVS